MKLSRVLFIVLVLLAGGCASGTRVIVADSEWSSRIGTYTYEDALAELGEPNAIGESTEGRIAEWVLRQSPGFSFGFGFGGGSYGHHLGTGGGVGATVSPPPGGEYLRLRFDQDGKLVEWTKARY
jgi:hypothetical protein